MKTKIFALSIVVAISTVAQAAELSVKAVNKLQLARPAQTIELTAQDLAPLQARNLNTIHVKDSSGKEVLCQAVDTDFDERRVTDLVIFQADFASGETKTFTVTTGAKQVFKKEDFKAYGRFNRERFDDFTWENDRIAHRTYGKALETWKGEPLTSSTIDIWSKRTPKMVINDWYMADDYHVDHGDGADFYSAGPSRGCGGNGIWANDKLWVSKNFIDSRVLANGPIRVMFELVYEPFDVNGTQVSEVKRITLDAGSQFDRFQSFYKGASAPLSVGVGLKKVNGEVREAALQKGWLAKWEPMEKNAGQQGLAAIADPGSVEKVAEDDRNHLLIVKARPDNSVTYWSGFAWDKAGRYTSADAWKKHVDEFAAGLQSPIEVSVTSK